MSLKTSQGTRLVAQPSRLGNRPAVTVGNYSLTGRKDRNDDSYGVVVPDGDLLEVKGIAMAIADGMTSSEAAKEASETCVHTFLEDYFATHPSWTVKTSVERVLTAANRWMHSRSETNYESGRGMVSTFTGVVLKSSVAYIFHAGDSRVSLLRGKNFERLTTDHRVRVSRDQEYLARAFGIARDLAVDYRTLDIERGDVLIFTTDGVHDHLRDGQLANIILAEPQDLNGAAERIVNAAFANNSPDNLTCQIVRIESPGASDRDAVMERLGALPFPPELEPGMRFDGYKILRDLHLSKRTQIYLAEDLSNGENVVLKTPSVNFADDAAYIEMFTREEWVGRLVSSPNVLKVLPPEKARAALYYVTEYVEGQTLRQWMIDHPERDLETVRGIVEQIARGLRAFHRKEILHRDIKPENILIDRSGTIKIVDFGSARIAGLEEAGNPVELPALVGTVDYTAPEYHLGEPPTTRSDIYSLGVVAYELLTGKLPYGRGFADAKDVTRLKYVPANRIKAAIPPWVDAAVAKAVQKSPAQRTEVLSALVEDLRKPNADLLANPVEPLIQRNPVGLWRSLAIALFLINVLLLFALSRLVGR